MYTETDLNFTPHFERFDMLDEGVKFVRGFFQDSLPLLRERFLRENRKIAVLYADGVLWNIRAPFCVHCAAHCQSFGALFIFSQE